MYRTTLHTTGKKLEVDIGSIEKMMSTVSIPFYFHQSLTHVSFHAVKNKSLYFVEKQNVLYS